jgi:hypothetical protein
MRCGIRAFRIPDHSTRSIDEGQVLGKQLVSTVDRPGSVYVYYEYIESA